MRLLIEKLVGGEIERAHHHDAVVVAVEAEDAQRLPESGIHPHADDVYFRVAKIALARDGQLGERALVEAIAIARFDDERHAQTIDLTLREVEKRRQRHALLHARDLPS